MEQNKKIIIAIDGYSSCGKSTVAKDIAKHFNYAFIDTGAMYRAVTLFALRNNLIADGQVKNELISRLDEIKINFQYDADKKINTTYLNGENIEEVIRELHVSQNVSLIATIKEVRAHLVNQQQQMGVDKGIVMDGRDIGTVVFPDAELKIFMTASPDVRAERRFKELTAKGSDITFEEIKQNVIERDRIDENRSESPLRRADDALLLDNSDMTMDEQRDWIIQKVKALV